MLDEELHLATLHVVDRAASPARCFDADVGIRHLRDYVLHIATGDTVQELGDRVPAGIFVERRGAHALGEGGGGVGGRREFRGRREKVWHGERIRVVGEKDENGREDILWV